jgi:RHS repeat-associated protein
MVWSPVYVDGLILRDRDADGVSGNGLEERLYAVQDANWNVQAVVSAAGVVVERYAYDPFGLRQVLDAGWSAVSGSSYDWVYGHQGGRLDAETGNVHFRHRDLDTGLMRWNRMDPIGYRAGDVNVYRAYGNNANKYLDPNGTDIIYLFRDNNGAIGHGHAAVLIGSDEHGWLYYSHSPTGGWYTGMWSVYSNVASIVLGRVFFQTANAALNSLSASDHYTHYVRYTTTQPQDMAAQAAAGTWSGRGYCAVGSNCVDLVNDTFVAAGITLPVTSVLRRPTTVSALPVSASAILSPGVSLAVARCQGRISSPRGTHEAMIRDSAPTKPHSHGTISSLLVK